MQTKAASDSVFLQSSITPLSPLLFLYSIHLSFPSSGPVCANSVCSPASPDVQTFFHELTCLWNAPLLNHSYISDTSTFLWWTYVQYFCLWGDFCYFINLMRTCPTYLLTEKDVLKTGVIIPRAARKQTYAGNVSIRSFYTCLVQLLRQKGTHTSIIISKHCI